MLANTYQLGRRWVPDLLRWTSCPAGGSTSQRCGQRGGSAEYQKREVTSSWSYQEVLCREARTLARSYRWANWCQVFAGGWGWGETGRRTDGDQHWTHQPQMRWNHYSPEGRNQHYFLCLPSHIHRNNQIQKKARAMNMAQIGPDVIHSFFPCTPAQTTDSSGQGSGWPYKPSTPFPGTHDTCNISNSPLCPTSTV